MINGLVSKGATRTCMKSLSVIALTCTVPKTHLTSACTGERKPLEAVSSTVAPPRTSAKYGEMDSAWTIVAVFRRMQRTTRRPTDAIANVLPADGMGRRHGDVSKKRIGAEEPRVLLHAASPQLERHENTAFSCGDNTWQPPGS